MQYLLTKDEYDALRAEQQASLDASKAKLQKLATSAANHIPILHDWAPKDPATPWGCILNKAPEANPGYCDDCPAQIICPHDGKEFSQ